MKKERKVKRIASGIETYDGAGVKLTRVLGHSDVNDVDPFLMLDAFGSDNPDDYTKGFPFHPHRGIETITYMINGRVDHHDSLGNKESLTTGNLQWMVAGSGILHEEMPQKTDGKHMGLQFWLNLPKKYKMVNPEYNTIDNKTFEHIYKDNSHIMVIAGEYDGKKAFESKYIKVTMLGIDIKPNALEEIDIAPMLNVFIYVVDGSASFGENNVIAKNRQAVIFEKSIDSSIIKIKSQENGVRCVLMAAKPLEESIAWGGPIVMNTKEELNLAFAELSNNTFIK